jgi:hypothetical protein
MMIVWRDVETILEDPCWLNMNPFHKLSYRNISTRTHAGGKGESRLHAI